jgi:hypothetical protein
MLTAAMIVISGDCGRFPSQQGSGNSGEMKLDRIPRNVQRLTIAIDASRDALCEGLQDLGRGSLRGRSIARPSPPRNTSAQGPALVVR